MCLFLHFLLILTSTDCTDSGYMVNLINNIKNDTGLALFMFSLANDSLSSFHGLRQRGKCIIIEIYFKHF